MLNSYSVSNKNSVKINAITGTIVKNYRDSFFLRFNLKSKLAEQMFGSMNPQYEYQKVIVLQVMLCGENEVICEVISKHDFDKLFEFAEKMGSR